MAEKAEMIIEQFQKILGVYTTKEALAKVAVLMREEDTASKLLSKALGHLETCDCEGSKELRNEIASAFGETAEQPRAADGFICPACNTTFRSNWLTCPQCGKAQVARR